MVNKNVEVVVVHHHTWTKQSWQLQPVAMTEWQVLLRDDGTGWFLCAIKGVLVNKPDGSFQYGLYNKSDVELIMSDLDITIQTDVVIPISESVALFWIKQQSKVTTFID